MKPVEKDIKALLDLERIDTNIFRGQSQDIGTKQVFGGQVLGQALAAAQMTISDRPGEWLRYSMADLFLLLLLLFRLKKKDWTSTIRSYFQI